MSRALGRPWAVAGAISALLWLAGALSARAQEASADAPVPEPEPDVLLPWLDFPATEPLRLRLRHELTYDPATRAIGVGLSDWEVARLRVRAFGGTIGLEGTGVVRMDRPSDIGCTVTLSGFDLDQALRFFNAPRAGDVRAVLDGTVWIGVRDGQWSRIELDIIGQPGTVSVSRNLLKDLLINLQQGDRLSAAEIDGALDRFFRGRVQIPLNNVHVVGRLGEERLSMRIPLSNEVLNIVFEPTVERGILWDLWRTLEKEGLEQIKDADWDVGGE